ncbi:DDB1- and CUL4-associated factor 4-like [Gigantopelta aegis]|uniref:DDB1- and CUL4-associated factor 4-like n=1 Tax=Gigantopelta aegis TaxID=1735272 RepID=UPI001B889F54|nr:DDB1- and CUL4-associated factor 4-like [Gigantopelta aegis]
MSNSKDCSDNESTSHSGKRLKKRKRTRDNLEANDSHNGCNINKNQELKHQKCKSSGASSSNKNETESRKSEKQEETISTPHASCSTKNSDEASSRKQRKTKEKCADCDGARNRAINNSEQACSSHKEVKWRKKQKSQKKKEKLSSAKKCNSDSTQEDDLVLKIPGFYYDKKKNRYFKILPSSNNVNVVTNETISFQEAESKRLKDLSNLESTSSRTDSSEHKCHKHSPPSENITTLIYRHHQGDVSKSLLEHSYHQKQVSWMKPAGTVKIFQDPDIYSNIEHMLQIDASRNSEKILGLWSVANSAIQRVQLLNLTEKPRVDTQHPLSVDINTTGATVLQSWNKITSLCWAPFSSDVDKKFVLYTTMCYTGYNFSLAFIRNLDPSSSEQVQVFDYNLGNHTTWTAAWNYHAMQFTVGAEKTCLLIDVETRRLWEFNTNKSDALAQVFAPVNGLQLYNGTRKGQILCHDLRSLSTRPVACMTHKTSIACLRMLQNGHQLFVSDFSGRLCLWDIRMRRVVLEYPSLHNEYLRLPFKIDPSESFIYGVGQNCYTNFWCLKSGKQLLSLPPPCPASIDMIPAVHYSNHWANRPGNSGLIMGIKDSLYLYSGRVEL